MKTTIIGCSLLLLVNFCSAQVKKAEDVIIADGGCADVPKAQKDCIAEIIFVIGANKVENCAAFRQSLSCFKEAGCTTETLKSIQSQLKCQFVETPVISLKAEGCINQDKARTDCVAEMNFLSNFDRTDLCGGFRGALYCFQTAGCTTDALNKIGKELKCSLLVPPQIKINPEGCARRERATRDCIANLVFVEQFDKTTMCNAFKVAKPCFKESGCTDEAIRRIQKDLTCTYVDSSPLNRASEK